MYTVGSESAWWKVIDIFYQIGSILLNLKAKIRFKRDTMRSVPPKARTNIFYQDRLTCVEITNHHQVAFLTQTTTKQHFSLKPCVPEARLALSHILLTAEPRRWSLRHRQLCKSSWQKKGETVTFKAPEPNATSCGHEIQTREDHRNVN